MLSGQSERRMALLYLGMSPFLFINDAKLFNDIFVKSPEIREFRDFCVNLKKHPAMLLSINGDLWRKRRKLNHSCFTSLIKANYIDKVMQSLMTDFMFPCLDRKAADTDSKTHYFCHGDLKWFGFAFQFGVFYGVNSDIPGPSDPEFNRFTNLNDLAFDALVKNAILSLGSLGAFLVDKLNIFEPWDEMGVMIRKWHQRYTNKRLEDMEEDTYFYRMTKHIEEGQISVWPYTQNQSGKYKQRMCL